MSASVIDFDYAINVRADKTMDNTGNGPLRVPGFNTTSLYFELAPGERFAHGANDWVQRLRLTAREVAMLQLMNILTDSPGWQKKVFDDDHVSRWSEAALATPLISARAWEWCLAEMKDKATYFDKTARILSLDVGSCVCKTDSLGAALQDEIQDRIRPLMEQSICLQDWCPGTNATVLNLIDPSLFPLIYGKTLVMVKGGHVPIDRCLESFGSGETAPSHARESPGWFPIPERPRWKERERDEQQALSALRWSTRFQCLPCDVEFAGPSATNVRIVSYINNLHPVRYQKLYNTIEKLVGLLIEPWNDVLIKGLDGRKPARIRTYGVESEPEDPEWALQLRQSMQNMDEQGFREVYQKAKDYLAVPESDEHSDRLPDLESFDDPTDLIDLMVDKYCRPYGHVHPEPGTAFTYEDWKAGRTGNAVVNKPGEVSSSPDPDHTFYAVKLQETFRKKGLQIFVKATSIELTPDNPTYDGDDWQIDGALNEHIVASAIYYFDDDNVQEGHVSFRQETEMDDRNYVYNVYDHDPIKSIFGAEDVWGAPAFQKLGSIATSTGRLLAWPNALQRRVEPFELQDKSLPGHRRFITISLVDPYYRICSTRNVPPQQHDWWAEPAFKNMDLVSRKIPQEVVDLIDEETRQWPIGKKEAEQLRLDMLAERWMIDEAVDNNMGIIWFMDH